MAIGVLLLAAWAVWWLLSLTNGKLLGGELTWLEVPLLGADFWSQTDRAARIWQQGLNPYQAEGPLFHYPPIVIFLFGWTPYFEIETALRIWIAVIAATIAIGTWLAWRIRKTLPVEQWPLVLPLGLVLMSFPVVFAMERANFDVITLMALLIAMATLEAPTRHRQLIAGAALAVGPWVKIYPGLLGVGLVALRWWRGLLGFVVAGLAIGLAAPERTLESFGNVRRLIAFFDAHLKEVKPAFFPWSHSLSSAASQLLFDASNLTGIDWLTLIPGWLPAALVVLPLLVWVCRGIYRCEQRDRLAYPLFLWIVSLASFVPQVANDYSLFFLPLTAISVWSRRDPPHIQAAMGLLLLWWQPFALPVAGLVMLLIKVVGLAAVGASLLRRAAELGPHEAAAIEEPAGF